jgi:hypothetical protein
MQLSSGSPPCLIYWTFHPDSSIDTITSLPPHGLVPVQQILNVRVLPSKDDGCRFQIDVRNTSIKLIQHDRLLQDIPQDRTETFEFRTQNKEDANLWVISVSHLFAVVLRKSFVNSFYSKHQPVPVTDHSPLKSPDPSCSADFNTVKTNGDVLLTFMDNQIFIVENGELGECLYLSELVSSISNLEHCLWWLLMNVAPQLFSFLKELTPNMQFDFPKLAPDSMNRLRHGFLALNRCLFLEFLEGSEQVSAELLLSLAFLYLMASHAKCEHLNILSCERCQPLWTSFCQVYKNGISRNRFSIVKLCLMLMRVNVCIKDQDLEVDEEERVCNPALLSLILSNCESLTSLEISEVVQCILTCVVQDRQSAFDIVSQIQNWTELFIKFEYNSLSEEEGTVSKWNQDGDTNFSYITSLHVQILFKLLFSDSISEFTQILKMTPLVLNNLWSKQVITIQFGVEVFNFLWISLLKRVEYSLFKFSSSIDSYSIAPYVNVVEFCLQVLEFGDETERPWSNILGCDATDVEEIQSSLRRSSIIVCAVENILNAIEKERNIQEEKFLSDLVKARHKLGLVQKSSSCSK